MKRLSNSELQKYLSNRKPEKVFNIRSEPHQIVKCCKCGASKELQFHLTGDEELYYICQKCGFESESLGKASEISMKRFDIH